MTLFTEEQSKRDGLKTNIKEEWLKIVAIYFRSGKNEDISSFLIFLKFPLAVVILYLIE